jgi:hypothetical protein
MGEVAEVLLELLRSPNENTRLSAVREICDRVLGRPRLWPCSETGVTAALRPASAKPPRRRQARIAGRHFAHGRPDR